MNSLRLEKAYALLEENGLDALLFTTTENVRYLSCFTGTEGTVLIGDGRRFFLTDSRYTEQADAECDGFEVIEYREKPIAVAQALDSIKAGSVGFEPQIPWFLHQEIAKKAGDRRFVSAGEKTLWMWAIKDDGEAMKMRRAARISDDAMKKILDEGLAGRIERDVAFEIELAMRRSGAEKLAFDIIVASGSRAALPHGLASTKKIAKGETVIIDFGCVYDGYASDQTITVHVGEPSEKAREIHALVKEAHDRAVEAVRPGLGFADLDSSARRVIERAGYAENFGHGLGHGLGLNIHEAPSVSSKGKNSVEVGMAFTIEPGVYLPGWGGVRLEDTVYVTPQGPELFTGMSKELIVVDA